MIPELGVFALILALCFSLLLVCIPTLGILKNNVTWQKTANYYVVGQFVWVACAYVCLTLCFLKHDFTVSYVLMHSSQTLPWFYRLCAVWGGHEGSMLLWVAVLSTWMLAVSHWSQSLTPALRVRVLVVLGALSAGFLLFLLSTSNPFSRQFVVMDSLGRDLNPLLQDPGFLFHPPMLYMGYVGFSVAFAFAVAALWIGRIEPAWAKWTRPWTLAAWCCLTLGITLGSWWAYRELGWGGWWFWDPVENASFMPWLLGTALIHALMVNEKRQQLSAWTLLLAIGTFSLSLMGTFLVRSGVLISVHAFAVDPARGLFILLLLAAVIGGSLFLFAWRGSLLATRTRLASVSRESALLMNTIFLTILMLTVLLGTLYPLIIDSLGLGKLSVGAPYFNALFVPLSLPLLFFMAMGIHVRWGHDKPSRIRTQLRFPFWITVCFIFFILLLIGKLKSSLDGWTWLALMLAFGVIISTLYGLFSRIKKRSIQAVRGAYIGMVLAHIGVALVVFGIALSSGLGVQQDVKMRPGETVMLAGRPVQFISVSSLTGPNYHGTKACFKIGEGVDAPIIFPEKRLYDVAHMSMTDAAIDVSAFRDIYVALGEPLGLDAWSVRLYYKPCVRWIWWGGFLMALGGFFALVDRRFTRGSKLKEATIA